MERLSVERMRVDSDRLQRDLATMARFTVPGLPWTRRPFTPEYAATRSWLREEMARCGLQSRLAPAGNLIGVFPGTEPSLPPILIGSHTDTVEGGGRFDGILGVLAGLEVVRQLRASGR
ncbi:MAG TPA: Zn-dependent hydrolase, partial [Thermaerobacter sp.]